MRRLFSLALSVLLSASLATAQTSVPVTPPAPIIIIPKDLNPPSKKYKLPFYNGISTDFSYVSVPDLLEGIGVESKLNIIISSNVLDGTNRLNYNTDSAETAVEEIVRQVDLDCWNIEDTYMVGFESPRRPLRKNQRADVTFEYRNISAAELLTKLGKQSKIKVTVSPDVTAKFPYIRLTHQTWESAIETVAMAAGLTCRRKGKRYVITKPVPTPSLAEAYRIS